MKIEFTKNFQLVRLDEISAGECFQHSDNDICMMCDNDTFVDLTTGEVWRCGDMDYQYGTLIDAKIVIG